MLQKFTLCNIRISHQAHICAGLLWSIHWDYTINVEMRATESKVEWEMHAILIHSCMRTFMPSVSFRWARQQAATESKVEWGMHVIL
jgi:hypothetical protein